MNENRLYNDLAWLWPLWGSPSGDYARWCAQVIRLIERYAARPVGTILNMGCGGGKNAWSLKGRYAVTGIDLSPAMLALARQLNPECKFIQADMRNFDLGFTFDAILVDDAISYMTTEADLRAAIQTAFLHCRPGGAALFTPDHIRETFHPATDHGGHDGVGRAMRYLEWTWDPDPDDSSYLVDMAYLLRDESGQVHSEHDRHRLGLFSRAEWLRFIEEAGFEGRAAHFEDGEDRLGSEVFLGIKRSR